MWVVSCVVFCMFACSPCGRVGIFDQVQLGRVNAAKCRDAAESLGAVDLPATIVFRRGRAAVYTGPHSSES